MSAPRKPSTPAQQARIVARFNARYPVGQRVRYWRGVRQGDGVESTTRSEAQVLSGHTAVVWIDGTAGCIALSHVEPLS